MKLYNEWNIQGFVLLSLSIQTILILFAPFRKRTNNAFIIFLLWVAYLGADWAANFGVGLISNSQKFSQKHDDDADILTFWAPFLLLHLGGPDTITAFALEDNALWQRHLVGLLSQVAAAIIVFGQSFPRNRLWVPTVLLFVAGTIKYGERTRALFLANLNRFRESMLKEPIPAPCYAKLMEEYTSMKGANLPVQIELIPEPNIYSDTGHYNDDDDVDEGMLVDVAAVEHAYSFFKIFDGLIVDLIFSFRESDDSRPFFRRIHPRDAFKVLAIELNFIYETLYTKVAVVHSMVGYIVRFISWLAVMAAFSTFYCLDKKVFRRIDVGITYTLLFGAIGLDTIALFTLVFSDWTAASIRKPSRYNCIAAIKKLFCPLLQKFLNLKRINWTDTKSTSVMDCARRSLLRRWSESLHQYSLIDYCLEERHHEKNYFIYVIDEYLGLKDIYDMKYVSRKTFTEGLWDFIFDELKMKSSPADDPETAKRICSVRGESALQKAGNTKLLRYIVDVEYDQSLILWHIATEILYHTESSNEDANTTQRDICKTLSDYMLYLLVMRPTMMSAVAGIGLKRFHDTCTEAKHFFQRKVNIGENQEQACAKILEVDTDVEPVAVNGDRSKSVLFDACILAKELRNLEADKKWKLMSEVWVELLSYAASHCRANTHAAQLSKGGELITFVWLLMAHFGTGDQYQINKGALSKF
ncbi:uncharacterized protein LOC132169564 [Corylus avellana]|uniref:uncharacterized protein LOC132169564 n=1 Tax=Corylus avellana TaxID=13451 RepID=UPI00286CAC95|nr:uncharacterized protein LOC132169564 [Corylus avellana]